MIDYNKIGLFFNAELHRYTDNFDNVYTSMTTLNGKYHIPFDAKKEARKYAKRHGGNADAIAQQWKAISDHSCDKGSTKHDKLEQGIKNTSKFIQAVNRIKHFESGQMFTIHNINLEDNIGIVDVTEFVKSLDNKYPRIIKMVEYFVDRGYKLYAEIGVFSFELLISGMVDLLAIHPNGTFYILDWKTNRNKIAWTAGYYKKDKLTRQLTNEWVAQDKPMLYPVNNLQDCTGVHYQMQLSGYAKLIELTTNYRCEGIYLIHIRDKYQLNKWGMPLKDEKGFYIPLRGDEDNEEIEIFNVNYIPSSMQRLFEHHYEMYGKYTAKRQGNLFAS